VELQPKKHQSVCTDITSRALVFDQGVTFQKMDTAPLALSQPSSSIGTINSDPSVDTTVSTSVACPVWNSRFGCSSNALPDAVKVTSIMLGRNSSLSQSKSGITTAGDDSDNPEDSDFDSDEEYGGKLSQSSTSRRRKSAGKGSGSARDDNDDEAMEEEGGVH
jgi:hypothetical protein